MMNTCTTTYSSLLFYSDWHTDWRPNHCCLQWYSTPRCIPHSALIFCALTVKFHRERIHHTWAMYDPWTRSGPLTISDQAQMRSLVNVVIMMCYSDTCYSLYKMQLQGFYFEGNCFALVPISMWSVRLCTLCWTRCVISHTTALKYTILWWDICPRICAGLCSTNGPWKKKHLQMCPSPGEPWQDRSRTSQRYKYTLYIILAV